MAAISEEERRLLLDAFALSEEQENWMKSIFESFDTDGDGAISKDEFRSFFEKLGWHPNQEELKGIMSKFDLDGDGEISWEEWKQEFQWHLTVDLDNIFRTFDADE